MVVAVEVTNTPAKEIVIIEWGKRQTARQNTSLGTQRSRVWVVLGDRDSGVL